MRREFLKAILGIGAVAAVAKADQFDSGDKEVDPEIQIINNAYDGEIYSVGKWDGTEQSLLVCLYEMWRETGMRADSIILSDKHTFRPTKKSRPWLKFKNSEPRSWIPPACSGLLTFASPGILAKVHFRHFFSENTVLVKFRKPQPQSIGVIKNN